MKQLGIYVFLFCVFLILPASSGDVHKASRTYPQDYFISPLDFPLSLSGSFGELRGTHFHAGLDFRTHGREGYKVYASADGFVSRINVSPTGYGKALYITHPNGFQTVYAHLSRFNDEIDRFVEDLQYRNRSFEVRAFPQKHLFPVKQGDIIAYSGNSGSSGGPHLHFEIRETRNHQPVNPMLFNLPVKDTYPPVIRGIRIYPLSQDAFIRIVRPGGKTEQSRFKPITFNVIKQGNEYRLANVASVNIYGDVGFSIETYDYHEGAPNRLGPSYISLKKNEQTIYSHFKETFNFNQSRYILAHVDHEKRMNTGRNFQRSYLLPANRLEFYRNLINNGIVNFDTDSLHHFRYIIRDDSGNESILVFNIKGLAQSPELAGGILQPEIEAIFPYNSPNSFNTQELKLHFPAYCFYDTVMFIYEEMPGLYQSYSFRHRIHNNFTPVHSFFDISIRTHELPAELRSKAYIATINDNMNFSYIGGKYENGFIKGRARTFGVFHVIVDTIAPKIRSLNFKDNTRISAMSTLRILIEDYESGIDSYNPRINGKWALMEYDAKNKLLIYNINSRTPKGKFELSLTVTDKKNNVSTQSWELYNE